MVTLSWLAGTPFRGQSPRVRTTHACMHIWAREHMGLYANTETHTETSHTHADPAHTRTHGRANLMHAQIHTQALASSSVMPSHPTLDRPSCEPDKAGEGTQQPLDAGAGCIRQLRVPVNCIYPLKRSALNPEKPRMWFYNFYSSSVYGCVTVTHTASVAFAIRTC